MPPYEARRRARRRARLLLIVIVGAVSVAATVFGAARQRRLHGRCAVWVDTVPQGLRVELDGEPVGESPVEVTVPVGVHARVVARSDDGLPIGTWIFAGAAGQVCRIDVARERAELRARFLQTLASTADPAPHELLSAIAELEGSLRDLWAVQWRGGALGFEVERRLGMLRARLGALVIESPPGATVALRDSGGRAFFPAPAEPTRWGVWEAVYPALGPGDVRVVVRLPGGIAVVFTATVVAGTTSRVRPPPR